MIAALSIGAVLATGGISAYFTDADTVTNTFTVGKVSIDLQEEHWNPANATNVTPKQVIAKDPKIKNDGVNTEYVFMQVTVPFANLVTAENDGTKNSAGDVELFTYQVNAGWTQVSSSVNEADRTCTHTYVYGTMQACTPLEAGRSTPTLFDSVTVANIVEDQGVEGTSPQIVVNGYGIQTNNIGTNDTTKPSEVWAVIANQNPSTAKSDENTNTDIIESGSGSGSESNG